MILVMLDRLGFFVGFEFCAEFELVTFGCCAVNVLARRFFTGLWVPGFYVADFVDYIVVLGFLIYLICVDL